MFRRKINKKEKVIGMDFSTYMNVKETVKGFFCGALKIIIKVLKWIIITVIEICRSVLYIISSIGVFLFGLMLPFGIYFGYTVAVQMLKGADFFEAKNWGMFLFCFGFPAVFIIVRNLTKPRK